MRGWVEPEPVSRGTLQWARRVEESAAYQKPTTTYNHAEPAKKLVKWPKDILKAGPLIPLDESQPPEKDMEDYVIKCDRAAATVSFLPYSISVFFAQYALSRKSVNQGGAFPNTA